jgi:dipeptide/tripeptide permease
MVIVLGVGMLKPNASAIVADLYPEGGARLDSGFTVFYMGINVGGFLGPLVTGCGSALFRPSRRFRGSRVLHGGRRGAVLFHAAVPGHCRPAYHVQ